MKKTILFLSFITLFFACSKNEDESVKTDNNYNRTALLTNWANNIIVPSYVNYQAKMQILLTDINSFNTTPTVSNLVKRLQSLPIYFDI